MVYLISPLEVAAAKYADLAHLVERHLAKVEVASSSLVIRSILSGMCEPSTGRQAESVVVLGLHCIGTFRKFSSAGRASALQAEGQRFEPVNFHQMAR